jgi:hypothetical protein
MLLDPTQQGGLRVWTKWEDRFTSYGATSDDLRCLLSAGLPTDSPDVIAAANGWTDSRSRTKCRRISLYYCARIGIPQPRRCGPAAPPA